MITMPSQTPQLLSTVTDPTVLHEVINRQRRRLAKRHKAAKNLHKQACKASKTLESYKDLVTIVVDRYGELLSKLDDKTYATKALFELGTIVGQLAPTHFQRNGEPFNGTATS